MPKEMVINGVTYVPKDTPKKPPASKKNTSTKTDKKPTAKKPAPKKPAPKKPAPKNKGGLFGRKGSGK